MEWVLYNRSVWFCAQLRQNTSPSLEFQTRRFSRCFIRSEVSEVNECDANPATGALATVPVMSGRKELTIITQRLAGDIAHGVRVGGPAKTHVAALD